MKRAAIYARKSTDEQTESIPTQVEYGAALCASRGWTTQPDLIFRDTGSRAEFVKRSDLARLRAAVAARDVDVVVMRDDSRLGGDMLRTTMIAQEFADAGVQIVFYSTGEPLDLSSPTARLVACVRGFAAEDERAKIASRTRESLERRARRGLVAGGAVYGYRNERTPDGVRRVIDDEQAAIVRELFRRYAEGDGLRTLAHDLNLRRVPPPRAGRRGTGSWAPSSLHAILRRELYVGRVAWGAVHKTYRGGTKIRTDEHGHELVAVDAPDLRIVDEAAWQAVQQRVEAERHRRPHGGGQPARHLLTGIARCGSCGGPIQVARRREGRESVPAYGCAWHRDRGSTVCRNGLRRPVAAVDAAVVAWIREALAEDVVAAVLRELRARLESRSRQVDEELPALEAEARRLRVEADRLVEALAASTTAPATLVRAIDERESRLRDLDARMRAARAARAAPGAIDLELRRLEREARGRLGQLAEVVARNPAEGRAVLDAFLGGGTLRFDRAETEEGPRYRVSGTATLAGDTIRLEGVPSGDRSNLIAEIPLRFVA